MDTKVIKQIEEIADKVNKLTEEIRVLKEELSVALQPPKEVPWYEKVSEKDWRNGIICWVWEQHERKGVYTLIYGLAPFQVQRRFKGATCTYLNARPVTKEELIRHLYKETNENTI